MVHNGIEYADMQLIAESYDLLRHACGLEVAEIGAAVRAWNETELESFLIEITARVLAKTDEATGQPLVDVILDAAGQKGTGRWTAQNALELGVPLTGITEAVFARSLSALKPRAGARRRAPQGPPTGGADRVAGRRPRHALYASKIVSYAQGFQQMAAAADDEGWKLDLGAMATIWRGGCIIRARFLDRIREAYDAEPGLANLMLADFFSDALSRGPGSVAAGGGPVGRAGHPDAGVLLLAGLLRRLPPSQRPGDLIQGLRDLFGAHTYQRIDREGTFHTMWGEDGREIKQDCRSISAAAPAAAPLHRLGPVAHPELAVDRGAVLLDRVPRDVQRLADLRVGGADAISSSTARSRSDSPIAPCGSCRSNTVPPSPTLRTASAIRRAGQSL